MATTHPVIGSLGIHGIFPWTDDRFQAPENRINIYVCLNSVPQSNVTVGKCNTLGSPVIWVGHNSPRLETRV